MLRFHTMMPVRLQPYYRQEIAHYEACFKAKDFSRAWRHLERAHIIGQAWPYEHSYAHWLMLKFGLAIKNRKEVIGQLPRLLVGGVKSFVGKIPVGNTGGADVNPLQKMEIPEDLKSILARGR